MVQEQEKRKEAEKERDEEHRKRKDADTALLTCSRVFSEKLKAQTPGRKKISQQLAAQNCKVSIRTIKNWDKGRGTPDWYCGRDMTIAEFNQRYKQGTSEKKFQDTVKKGLKNPSFLK